MSKSLDEFMCGDIWTWLSDIGYRVFRYWVYKRMFTPLEQEQKYMDQCEFEDSYCKEGIIRECVELPDGDFLLGFQNVPDDDDYNDDVELYIEYYKLSEIRLAYHPTNREE